MSKARITVITPRAHMLFNFGDTARSVTFNYLGTDYTINRRGKSNVKVYVGEDTVTVTNGTDSVKRMTRQSVTFLTVIDNNGTVTQPEL